MRVGGNKVKHLSDFYRSELAEIYSPTEIEILFAATTEAVLGFSRTDLLLKKEENINQSDLIKLYDYAKALRNGIPLQYVLGDSIFYGLHFFVDSSVLIPRPETEELVELVLKENKEPARLLDLGTGSGCIPVSIKKNRPNWEVFACDISDRALQVARKNAFSNSVDVSFFRADILQPDSFKIASLPPLDLMVSNPPYIKKEEAQDMSLQVKDHEPHLALFVDHEDPVVFYKKIIDLALDCLNAGGRLYFELNPLTSVEVKNYADATLAFEETTLIKDMSGHLRFFRALKKFS